MVDMKSVLILMLELLLTVLIVQGQLSLGIEPATRYTGATLTVTCDVRSITTIGVNIFKDTDQLYTCLFTNAPCSDRDDLSDYADVDWSQTGKAVVIISNADSTRDDGVWTCSGDDTTQKSNEISLIITDRTTTVSTTTVLTTTVPTTTALADSSNNDSAPTDTSTPERSTTTIPTTTSTDNSTPTSPTGVTDTSAHTTQRIQKLRLSDKQRIGLIAGGVGVVVVICCSICICAIMRRKVNKTKRRRRQETKQEVEANVQISETL